VLDVISSASACCCIVTVAATGAAPWSNWDWNRDPRRYRRVNYLLRLLVLQGNAVAQGT
jgi:hypothetical protein